MNQNDHGVFIDGFEEIGVGDSYRLGLRISLGEYFGMWGYALSFTGKTYGQSEGLTPRECVFFTRRNMFIHAKRRIERIDIIKEFSQKMQDELFKKLDSEINQDLFGGDYE